MMVLGTRPELIKLAPVVNEALKAKNEIELIICSTGQHNEMLKQVVDLFQIKFHENLNVMKTNQTLSALMSRLFEGIERLIDKYRPDVVMVQGDTASALAGAMVAFLKGKKVAHVEAGLRTNNIENPFPEEGNRQIISRIATWNFAPTPSAVIHLKNEGIKPENIYLTGNTIVDAIELIKEKWKKDDVNNKLKKEFFLKRHVYITAHRRENIGQPLKNICEAIKELSEEYKNIKFIFSVHLNPAVREIVENKLKNIQNLEIIEPVNFEESLLLQSSALLVVTDSGGMQEECPTFGVPCIVVRDTTERMEGVDAKLAYLAGTEKSNIIKIFKYCLEHNTAKIDKQSKNPYGNGEAAKKILQILLN